MECFIQSWVSDGSPTAMDEKYDFWKAEKAPKIGNASQTFISCCIFPNSNSRTR